MSLTSILDTLADQLAPTFRTEAEYVGLKKEIAELRETFPADVASIATAAVAEK